MAEATQPWFVTSENLWFAVCLFVCLESNKNIASRANMTHVRSVNY